MICERQLLLGGAVNGAAFQIYSTSQLGRIPSWDTLIGFGEGERPRYRQGLQD
jgi:hypothetical protein